MDIVLRFLHNLGTGSSLPKTTLRAKINGVWARGACKNLGPPFSATIEASNFKFGIQLGLGEELAKKQLLRPNWRGSGLWDHPEIWNPLFISATIEASNFKFGIQVGHGK